MAQGYGGEQDQEVAARYCVVSHKALATFNDRPAAEVVRAQRGVDDDMLSALESMVKAARAGELEGIGALRIECVAW